MGRVPDNSALKRKRVDSKATTQKLSDPERRLYDLIRSKEDMGIWKGDMKWETKLLEPFVTKSLKSLKDKRLIKEVVNIHKKGKKYFMAVEFEPSMELTGGAWYVEGKLDTEFIQILKEQCMKHIYKLKVATVEGITESIRKSGLFKVECTIKQIAEIVQTLVLDNEVVKISSTGTGDFTHIPVGTECYRCSNKGGVPRTGAMASIPCGVCPRINDCTPDGIISPTTCVYYKKWLDF
ncbi:RNA polymerase Rpc34 [Macleaya cordata]|uniref:RNA polymerase Rpc34 n=1 Tax=Macleaya cordata TaxID=56857 RepID=A0A200R9V4_MACCD|nr:RNA polymerase Rpc34 [Macleaya cordata]